MPNVTYPAPSGTGGCEGGGAPLDWINHIAQNTNARNRCPHCHPACVNKQTKGWLCPVLNAVHPWAADGTRSTAKQRFSTPVGSQTCSAPTCALKSAPCELFDKPHPRSASRNAIRAEQNKKKKKAEQNKKQREHPY